MAIFCKTCIAACCSHCVYYTDDPEDFISDDEYTGMCEFHDMRTEFMHECNDFFCVAAQSEGIGYSSDAGDSWRSPGFPLDTGNSLET